MKTLEEFSQSTTMKLVGNKDGHCYGMCAATADYVINHWNTVEGGSFLGPFVASYVKARKAEPHAWAIQSEKIQKAAAIGKNRTSSVHVALVDGGLGDNFCGLQVVTDGLYPKLTDLVHDLILEIRYRTSYPVNALHRGTYLYLIDYRLPRVEKIESSSSGASSSSSSSSSSVSQPTSAMVDAGHAILLGILLGGVDEWDEIMIFDPNQGVLECDILDKATLDTWWVDYCRGYRGMGLLQVVNVADINVI